MTKDPRRIPRRILGHWGRDETPRPAPDAGLINRTYLVGTPPSAVLQWVNPIFDPRIHLDIAALGDHLEGTDVVVPDLLATDDGRLWIDDPQNDGVWRLLSYLPGRTVHSLDRPELAAAAGELVGRFHAALASWDHEFVAPPRRIHETEARMEDLRRALESCDGHALAEPARDLGGRILRRWERWRGRFRLDLPERPCHGDLKISNLRFDESGRAVALLDLDTLGPQTLAAEMGDAWRSWCHPAGEDATGDDTSDATADGDAEDPHEEKSTRFDLDLFAASAQTWARHLAGVDLGDDEIESLVPGIERICLELASRFCADSVHNTYFREDRERWPEAGRHNLVRAAGQMRLAAAAGEARARCRRILEPLLQRSSP